MMKLCLWHMHFWLRITLWHFGSKAKIAWLAKLVTLLTPNCAGTVCSFLCPNPPSLVWACQAISQVLRRLSLVSMPWLSTVVNPRAVSLSIGGANVGGLVFASICFAVFCAGLCLPDHLPAGWWQQLRSGEVAWSCSEAICLVEH